MEIPIEETSATTPPEDERPFLRDSIEEAMARLAPGARAVFVLHDVEGYTHEEIATTLGITSGGSKSQLFKARARMRRLLAHLVDAGDRRGPGTAGAPVRSAASDRVAAPGRGGSTHARTVV